MYAYIIIIIIDLSIYIRKYIYSSITDSIIMYKNVFVGMHKSTRRFD